MSMFIDVAIMAGIIFAAMVVALYAIIGFAELLIKWFEKDDK